jgi:hypothetical protein
MKNKTGCPHTSASQPCTICAEVYRALDALFPKGWEKDDILSLGSTVEGVVKTSFEDMQRAEAAEAEIERLWEALGSVRGLLEPYPIENFRVTHTMYSDWWNKIGDLLGANA